MCTLSLLFALFIGIIQGLTEFLPVSSSGHLSIMQNIFGLQDVETSYFTFDILLHLSTLVAVFIVFHKDIFDLIKAFFTLCRKLFKGKFRLSEYDKNERFVVMILIATLPLVFVLFFRDGVAMLYKNTKLIGCVLIINALMLYVSDTLAKGGKDIAETKPVNALIVGLCQLLAITPGLSRSGSTITGGLTQGFSREYAVKFSFILSIPAILGANILEIPEILANPVPSGDILPYAVGMVAALLTGIAAMKLLQYISRNSNFRIFSYYCAIVGILAIIFG